MNARIIEEPSQALIAAIEQQISSEPRSSITTILPSISDEDIFDISYMAATVDEEPAGIALIRSNSKSVVELHKLVVIDRFRKTGVGTSLFRSLVERCRRKGVKSLMIDPTNGSQHFWSKVLQGLDFDVYLNNGVIDVTL
jgi:GNAT superfamily N-acetyltransferase